MWRMDFVFRKRIADRIAEHRTTEVVSVVYGRALEEITDDEMCARFQRIRAEEKAFLIAEDAAVKRQTDERSEV